MSTARDATGYVDPRVLRTCALLSRTAADLVLEGGPAAVGVEAVSSRARVARSTVYRHFPLREDLLAAAVDFLLPPLNTVLPDGSTEQRLHLVAARFAEHLATPSGRAALPAVLAVAAGADQRPQRRFVQGHREPLMAVLRAGVEAGELAASTDLETGVAELLGPLLFQALLHASPLSAAQVASVVHSFMRAHAAEPTAASPRGAGGPRATGAPAAERRRGANP